MRGFQAEGAAPLVTGEPFPDPETNATAIRVGNPASWTLAEAAATSPTVASPRSPTTQILAAQRDLAAPRRRLRRARVGSRRGGPAAASSRRASPTPGSPIVVTVTGHGLKDTATALEGLGRIVDTVVDADVHAAAAAAGLA